MDGIEEEHHAILFRYKADKQIYGKLIEQLEMNVAENKRPFSKIDCWGM